MGVDFFIASRLRLRNEGLKSIPLSIVIAVSGVALAVIVMLFSVSIVTGFKHQIRSKVAGFESQVTLKAVRSDSLMASVHECSIDVTPTLLSLIQSAVPESAVISYKMHQPAILKPGDSFMGIVFDGCDSARNSFLYDNIISGRLPEFGCNESGMNEIVLSDVQARKLKLQVGDKIPCYFFIDSRLRVRNPYVAAIYSSNFSDYDNSVAYCDLRMLQRLNGYSADQCSEIAINGIDNVEQVSDMLQGVMASAYHTGAISDWINVENVRTRGAVYFNWLDLLDMNVVVVLILMAFVSAFTLISSMFILILQRVPTIGLLKAIGACDAIIRKIFIIMAMRIVLIGLLLGNIIGCVLLWIQKTWKVIPLDPEAYYLDYVPVELSVWAWILINLGVLLVALCVLLLPAHVISGISPAKTMRYE